jgi:hypothetical protein
MGEFLHFITIKIMLVFFHCLVFFLNNCCYFYLSFFVSPSTGCKSQLFNASVSGNRAKGFRQFVLLQSSIFAFGLSAKLMPKALELLFPHPPHPPTPFVDFFF